MHKKVTTLFAFGIFCTATAAFASGYRIPEQSMNAVALTGALVAAASGADASYYNPANMSWQPDSYLAEASLTMIYLPAIDYTDHRNRLLNASSETEHFFLPQIHLVSKDFNKFRFGFSIAYPFGLSKEWDAFFPKASSQEFTLEVYEANPTVSYRINDMISLGGGIRFLYGKGNVKSLATNPPITSLGPLSSLSRDLDGDATEFGYNLALSIRPVKQLTLGATYRSKVDLDIDGDATLQATAGNTILARYQGSASVTVVTPAVLSIGAAYTFNDRTTVEVAWDRTFWSDYEQLDFNYSIPFNQAPFAAFDQPITKDWDDSDAIRIGLTHAWTDNFTLMLGFAYDDSPIPDKSLGFELPGSEAYIYSGGFRYQVNKQMEVGVAYLYRYNTSREVLNFNRAGQPNIYGKFDAGGAHVINVGIKYTF